MKRAEAPATPTVRRKFARLQGMTNTTSKNGRLLATAMAGAWRQSPPPMAMSAEELGKITPLLLETGGGALGWWRFRHSPLATSPAGKRLRRSYRLHAIEAAVHEHELARTVGLLRSAGIEPLLAKGWAIARLYAESGLRPYGDIDLLVPREAYADARATPGVMRAGVDLHERFGELADRPMDELYRRSQLVALGDVDIRMLGAEDQLRLQCLHLLRHGFWRPTWLCDVGVALDRLPPDFDWDYFLSGKERSSSWVMCVIRVAQQMLDARADVPADGRMAAELPEWLVPAVLQAWGTGHPDYDSRFRVSLRHPAGVLRAVRNRWPSRIQAAAGWRAPSSKVPVRPLQAWDLTVRGATWLRARSQGRA